jgi:activator of HSP90 ATPase
LGAENSADQWITSTQEYHNFLKNLNNILSQQNDELNTHDNDSNSNNNNNNDSDVKEVLSPSKLKSDTFKEDVSSSSTASFCEKTNTIKQNESSSNENLTNDDKCIVPKYFMYNILLLFNFLSRVRS